MECPNCERESAFRSSWSLSHLDWNGTLHLWGFRWQAGWHFIDEPLLDQGGKISDFNFTFDTHNITEVINALKDMYNNKAGYKDSYEYKTIMSHTYKQHDDETVRSWGMRFLIHYTGDVHQPLHATSRVDKQYPKGDRGGNDFPLPSVSGANELHAVWDSVIYEYTGYGKLVSKNLNN